MPTVERTLHFTILGFIWCGDDEPITLSVETDDAPIRFMYMQIPLITDGIRAKAAERGIPIGVLVDELNAAIPSPEPLVSWTFDSVSGDLWDTLRRT